MSDPRSSYGDPVDEPTDAERDADVVGRAREGLAEAEAARADLPAEQTEPDRPADAPETVVVEETVVVQERVEDEPDDDRWAMYAASADESTRADDIPVEDARRADVRADDTPTQVAAAPVVTPSEPASQPASQSASAYPGAQPIFVQAPEAPRPRGNRGAAGAIGLLAALVFAVLYLAAALGLGLLDGVIELTDVPETALAGLTTWSLWVPVVVFFLAFWLLGAVINRGRWGHWVVWGLLVGFAAYAGHILGAFFEAPFWMLTEREGAQLLEAEVLAPLAIVAFVLGRELTIWFGAWVAARGRRVTELNEEAQREYERTLEAGPQLHRA
ncbi:MULTISPECIES: ABC transporter [Microbacterium]|uniref:ABC transporter n=1 Tax=Microbacterium wangchenii TaxID=2541726 RepID=A0ABX5SS51_9MICO|nr:MULTISPECIES: ABC transporter [Microbacterium]MCK6068204.1 ABC transporter [Microbacterium sp. EYE_512]QBR87684.1 ABC transporter [Microbacterium wangchenii]TFV84235.1 ABC transporter [Microbacterium sp. dk485]